MHAETTVYYITGSEGSAAFLLLKLVLKLNEGSSQSKFATLDEGSSRTKNSTLFDSLARCVTPSVIELYHNKKTDIIWRPA